MCAGDAICILWFELRVSIDLSLVVNGLRHGYWWFDSYESNYCEVVIELRVILDWYCWIETL